MPRRSILSAAERDSLLALPDFKNELIQHYTFNVCAALWRGVGTGFAPVQGLRQVPCTRGKIRHHASCKLGSYGALIRR